MPRPTITYEFDDYDEAMAALNEWRNAPAPRVMEPPKFVIDKIIIDEINPELMTIWLRLHRG